MDGAAAEHAATRPSEHTLLPAADQPGSLFVAGAERRVRLRTFVMLRWIAIGGQSAAVLVATLVFGMDWQFALALGLVGLSAAINVAAGVFDSPARVLSDREVLGHLGFDMVQLSLLVAATGGFQNPFAALMAAPVVIGFSAAPARQATLLAGGASIMAVLVWFVHLPLPWRPAGGFAPPLLYELGIAAALVSAAGFMSLFAWRSASEARRMSAALAATEVILAREQKLSALGGLAAAAAHELGTPLGSIYIAAKEMERFLPRGTAMHDDALLLVSQAERCRDLLRQLSQRRHQADPIHAQLALRDLLEEVVAPLSNIGPAITVALGPPDPDSALRHQGPMLQRSPEMIYAIGNYVENAIAFAQKEIRVTGRWTGDHVEIEVRDDGPGFAPEILKRLGEPYVTTRAEAGEEGGLGLGFFIAKSFVERKGGTVIFGNARSPETGAIIRARWPLSDVQAAPTVFKGSGHPH